VAPQLTLGTFVATFVYATLVLISSATNANLPDPHAPIARAYGLMMLTLAENRVSAITWFGERSLLSRFGLPRTLAV
jgi:hypothetical protein